jgi:hypothetical protein
MSIALGLALVGTPAWAQNPPRPMVGSVAPASGPAEGGTPITVTGFAFLPGATLTIGNVEARKVVVVSSSKITAVTGPHPAGSKAVDVTVANPDGQSGSRARTFKYVASPARQGSPSK